MRIFTIIQNQNIYLGISLFVFFPSNKTIKASVKCKLLSFLPQTTGEVIHFPLVKNSANAYRSWVCSNLWNVTSEDNETLNLFCQLHCNYSFIDLCDTRDLPGIGDLNSQFPVGRFWRFQALADPTVEIFGSRDSDSFLSEREEAAVLAWLRSGEQFHVMRDGPFHTSQILAGLWGANNYINLTTAAAVRKSLFSVKPQLKKSFDQITLNSRVWPVIRERTAIFDSYNCRDVKTFGHCRPWPTQRQGYQFVGYGPTKHLAVKFLKMTKCPAECRPEEHQDWMYC